LPQPPDDRVRRFQLIVQTTGEAASFLDHFSGKFGYFGAWSYSCSETASDGPAAGPYIASVSLAPWHNPIDPRFSVNFGKLLCILNATEISD
jgi:hypothetical protein